MKQFRVVYEYKRDLMRGAGAAFVIALDESDAKQQLERAMPGVKPIQITEEKSDPLAQYERRPVLSVVKPPAEAPPQCELCEALLVVGPEVQRRVCADCELSQPKACAVCGDTRPPKDFPGFAAGTFMVCQKCSAPRVLA